MLDKPAITNVVARTVQGMMGVPIHVAVKTGVAPADRTAPAAAAPISEEEDALEAFLSGGMGNIIVE